MPRRPTPEEPEKSQRLTLTALAAYDDVCTDVMIDNVYFRSTIRKNRSKHIPIRGVKEDEVPSILLHKLFVEKDVVAAEKALLELTGLKRYTSSLSSRTERDQFLSHFRKYISIYRTDCPWEVSTTNRYTITTFEAAVTARQRIKQGETIRYLVGTLVPLTAEESEDLDVTKRDFSIVVSSRKKHSSIFLGPARFANHDCEANGRLVTKGTEGMEVIAMKNIDVGDEITVSYGDDYFGRDNVDCLCHSCESAVRNGWSLREMVETSPSQESSRSGTEEPSQQPSSARQKRKRDTPVSEQPMGQGVNCKRAKPTPSHSKLQYSWASPADPLESLGWSIAILSNNPESPAQISPPTLDKLSNKDAPEKPADCEEAERPVAKARQALHRISSTHSELAGTDIGDQIIEAIKLLDEELEQPIGDAQISLVTPLNLPLPLVTYSDSPTPSINHRRDSSSEREAFTQSTNATSLSTNSVEDGSCSQKDPLERSCATQQISKQARRPHPKKRYGSLRAHLYPSSEYFSSMPSIGFDSPSPSPATPIIKAEVLDITNVYEIDANPPISDFGELEKLEPLQANSTEMTTTNAPQNNFTGPSTPVVHTASHQVELEISSTTDLPLQPLRRPRGRPRKYPRHSDIVARSSFETPVAEVIPSVEQKGATKLSPRKSSSPPPMFQAIRTPGDYILTRRLLAQPFDRWVQCRTCFNYSVQHNGYQTRRECPRCERHSMLYGFAWPKTDPDPRRLLEKKGSKHAPSSMSSAYARMGKSGKGTWYEGGGDEDERVMDHRTVHRFLFADEERFISRKGLLVEAESKRERGEDPGMVDRALGRLGSERMGGSDGTESETPEGPLRRKSSRFVTSRVYTDG